MIKRLLIILILVLSACGNADETPAPTATPTEEPFYAPDFTLNSIDGTPYTLSELQGQWVILNFWATWCKPCVEEMPVLQEIADTRDDLVLLGINVREDPALVEPFLADNNITYPILMTPQGVAEDQVLVGYFPSGMALPQTIIIDPHGEIVWRAFTALELESFSSTLEEVMESS